MKKALLILVFLLVFAHANTLVKSQAGCDYVVGQGETFTEVGNPATTTKDVLDQAGVNWAGKTICVRNNKEYPGMIIEKGGTTSLPLTIRSHPNNSSKPVFKDTKAFPDYDKQFSGNDGIWVNADSVTVDSLEVSRASRHGVYVGAQSGIRKNVILLNLTIHDTFNTGINITKSEQVLVDRAEVYRNQLVGTVTNCLDFPPSQCTISEVVKATDSDHVTIKNSRITEDMSPGRGGVLTAGRLSTNISFTNNEIYGNTGNQMHIGNFTNIVFENNLIEGTTGDTGTGMFRLGERYPRDKVNYTFRGDNFVFRNNLLVGLARGINFDHCEGVDTNLDGTETWVSSNSCPFNNVTVENNTVVGIGAQDSGAKEDKEFALKIAAMRGYPANNITIKNNIFHTVNGQAGDVPDLDNGLGSRVSFEGNIWSDNPYITSADQEIRNLLGVFPANPDLTRTFTGRVDPSLYQVATTYNGKGADISKVGINRDGTTPPIPIQSPTPSPTPEGDTSDWDLDEDSDVDVFDFNRYIKKVMTNQDSWSRLASFVAAFRFNAQ